MQCKKTNKNLGLVLQNEKIKMRQTCLLKLSDIVIQKAVSSTELKTK